VYLQGGNLDISNGGNQTIGALYGTYYGAGRSAVILGANTLTFGGAADAVFDGAITGTGGIVKAGSGTQTFGVSRSSLGSVSVQAGALVLGRGLYPVTFNLSGGFSQSSGATSVLAGSTLVAGSMALSGGSVLIDGRASAGSGASVANAALVVGDSATPTAILAANVNLGTGGLLRGHGTIVGNVVNGAGTMFPGGSIGVLTVNGNYVQSPGGTLAIEVTPNAAAGPGVGYSQLLVTGTASLAGGLAVQLDSGSYVVGSRYTVLHANGGVSGGFASVAASPGFAAYLTPQVTYDATDAIVQLVLAQTAAGVVPAFDTGRGMVANQFVVNHSLFAAMGAVLDGAEPQGGGRTDVARGSWMTALGGFGRANGFDTQSGGVVVGHGVAVSADWTVGAAVSGLFTGTSGGVSKIDGQSVGVQAYGIYRQDRLRVSGMVGVGLLSDQSSRFLPPLGLSGRASNDGWYTGLATRAQYRLGTDRLSVEPYAEAMVLHTDLGGATETGAGMLNLRYGAIRNDLARLAVGVRVATVLPTAFGGMKPWAQLGAAGTLGNPRIREAETLGVLQGSVQADAARAGEVDLGAGVTMVDTGPWTLSAEWGGQYGGGATANLFSLKGRYVW
jgi:hypothetical protein